MYHTTFLPIQLECWSETRFDVVGIFAGYELRRGPQNVPCPSARRVKLPSALGKLCQYVRAQGLSGSLRVRLQNTVFVCMSIYFGIVPC